MIVGVVIGSVVFVAIVGLVIYKLRARKVGETNEVANSELEMQENKEITLNKIIDA